MKLILEVHYLLFLPRAVLALAAASAAATARALGFLRTTNVFLLLLLVARPLVLPVPPGTLVVQHRQDTYIYGIVAIGVVRVRRRLAVAHLPHTAHELVGSPADFLARSTADVDPLATCADETSLGRAYHATPQTRF